LPTETSLLALEVLDESGGRETHNTLYLEALRAVPGSTVKELREWLTIHGKLGSEERHNGYARMDDLVKANFAEIVMTGEFDEDDQPIPAKRNCNAKAGNSSKKLYQYYMPTTRTGPYKKFSLAELGCETMEDYWRCDHWVGFRTGYFLRHPKVCWITGRTVDIDLHHLHYESIGCEVDKDVIPLCRQMHEYVEAMIESGVPRKKAHIYLKKMYQGGKIKFDL
jgi:hypothetical protein